jgi:uncharacterized protein (TIGR02001 family)
MPAVRSRARPAKPGEAARPPTDCRLGLASRLLLPGLLLALAAPVRAELAFSGVIATDDRFRGDSTSGNRPVATVSAAYDDVHGPYFGISFTAVAAGDYGLKPLRSTQYAGYAKRLDSGLSLDVGVIHRISSHYYSGEYARDLTEAYVGVVGRRLSSHIFFSPNYDGHGGDSLYGEVEALLLDRGKWSLSSHVGALVPPREGPAASRTIEVDGRLGATRRFGRTAISLNWVAATPANDSRRWRGTALLSISHNF